MPNLPPKTVVASGPCSDCGKPVQIKVNVNGFAYYFCTWCDEDGTNCAHHEKWGRKRSQEMQRAYLASRKSTPKEPENVGQHGKPAQLSDAPQSAGPVTPDNSGDIFKEYG